MTFAMRHDDRDPFTYATEGESTIGTVGIAFTPGADGKATEVVVKNREGTFARAPTDR